MLANVMKPLVLFPLVLIAGCAHKKEAVRTAEMKPAQTAVAETAAASTAAAPIRPATPSLVRAEQIRTECIKGRRLICGKVLKVFHDGLVVESGYTDLVRPPLTESW